MISKKNCYAYIKLSLIDNYVFYKEKPFQIFYIFRGYWKKATAKLFILHWEKKDYLKYWVVNVEIPGHQATWLSSIKYNKHDAKETHRVNVLFPKSYMWIIKSGELTKN